MKKRALHKEFRVEVRKTFNRFLSILLIVALGVAFFSGLRSCKQDMLDSAGQYYDSVNLMDLYVLSTMGFSNDDVTAVSKVDGVGDAEGGYVKDVLVSLEQENIVVRTYSMNDRINLFDLTDGREPENNSECMVDSLFLENNGYQLGDTITLFSEEEDLADSLLVTTLTIVGVCHSARYLSFTRGTGEIGNGSIDSFLVMPKSNYKSDIYTELYGVLSDELKEKAYSKEYTSAYEEVKANVEAIADTQCEIRYEDAISGPRETLANKRSEYESSLADLTEKKESANQEFAAAESNLASAKEALDQMGDELEKKKQGLYDVSYGTDDVNAMLAPYINAYEQAKAEYESSNAELNAKKEAALAQFDDGFAALDEAKIQLDQSQAELDAVKMPEWYVGGRDWIDSYVSFEQDADRMNAIAKVFPAIFFFVAALVALTTMTRMVDEQRMQIGVLKAIGYSAFSISGKFLKYAFYATLIGSVIGAAIGQKVFPYVVIDAYRIMYQSLPDIVMPYRISHALVAGLIAILCTMAATLIACLKDLSCQPAALMRPVAPKAGKRIGLERVPFIWNHLNFTKKSTMRNLFRYKKRFFMTVIGIGGCMALILVGFGIKDSISVMSKVQYGELFLEDAELTIDDTMTQQQKELFCEQIMTQENITAATLIYKKSVTATAYEEGAETKVTEGNGKTATMLVLPSNADFSELFVFRNRITHQSTSIEDTGVIVTEKYAKMLGVSAGDQILIDTGNDKKVSVTIQAVVENYLRHYIYMTESCYEALFKDAPVYNGTLIKTASLTIAQEQNLHAALLKNYDEIRSISSTREMNQRIQDMLTSLNIIVYVLIFCAALLAFIVLYNLSNININERKRELASLKVLGFYDGEVNSYVMKENVWLTMLGILLGIGIGVLLHGYVITTCEIDEVMFGRLIAGISYGYSAVLTLLFSLIICGLMYFKLKKIDMIEALKSVE